MIPDFFQMTIKLNSQKQMEGIEYNASPVLQVSKIYFSMEGKNWVHKLMPASNSIKISVGYCKEYYGMHCISYFNILHQ